MTEEKCKNLNESIINIRVKLQNAKLKKSGKNKYADFDYFELADFLPKLNELMLEEGVNDRYRIEEGYAILELIKRDEKQEYTIPFKFFETPLTYKKDKQGNIIYDDFNIDPHTLSAIWYALDNVEVVDEKHNYNSRKGVYN